MGFKAEKQGYAKINLEFDRAKKGKQKQEIVGDEPTIAALLGKVISELLKNGFDRETLEYSIKKGLIIVKNKHY